jgi:membrane protein
LRGAPAFGYKGLSPKTGPAMPHLTEARRNRLDWLLQLAFTAWRLFMKNGLQNHAAATAFYFMLSATPLLLLLTYGSQWLARLAETSVPATMMLAALYDQLRLDSLTEMGFIPARTQLAAGGVGLLTLLLASRGLVNAIQGAFTVIFPAEAKRRFVVSWTLPLLIIPIAFLLLGLAVVVQATLSFLAQNALLGAGQTLLFQGLNYSLSFVMVWALIFLAYWRMPRQHPPPRSTALVALLATLSLLALLALFGQFFEVEKYRSLYGALGGVVFVLIGAYFAWLLFYFWAQCLFTLGKVDVVALERLFLGSGGAGAGRLEGYVFGRAGRLLDKYGETHPAGALLIQEGDASKTAFFLYGGQVGIYKTMHGETRKLGVLEEGELFGEMAYLLGEARTATIKAETEVVVLALPPAMLEELMRYSAPLARRIIDTLCQRLQRMNLAANG